jgi:hypothetical protein
MPRRAANKNKIIHLPICKNGGAGGYLGSLANRSYIRGKTVKKKVCYHCNGKLVGNVTDPYISNDTKFNYKPVAPDNYVCDLSSNKELTLTFDSKYYSADGKDFDTNSIDISGVDGVNVPFNPTVVRLSFDTDADKKHTVTFKLNEGTMGEEDCLYDGSGNPRSITNTTVTLKEKVFNCPSWWPELYPDSDEPLLSPPTVVSFKNYSGVEEFDVDFSGALGVAPGNYVIEASGAPTNGAAAVFDVSVNPIGKVAKIARLHPGFGYTEEYIIVLDGVGAAAGVTATLTVTELTNSS